LELNIPEIELSIDVNVASKEDTTLTKLSISATSLAMADADGSFAALKKRKGKEGGLTAFENEQRAGVKSAHTISSLNTSELVTSEPHQARIIQLAPLPRLGKLRPRGCWS